MVIIYIKAKRVPEQYYDFINGVLGEHLLKWGYEI